MRGPNTLVWDQRQQQSDRLRWRSSVGEPSEFETPMHPINIAFRLFIVIELISEQGKAVRGPSLGSGGMGEAPLTCLSQDAAGTGHDGQPKDKGRRSLPGTGG